jgi:uncharacterized repeat protein (TIGR01451 family)
MKKLFLQIALLLISALTAAQPAIQWQRSLGGSFDDQVHDLQPTADGGYILAGYTGSNDGDVTANQGIYDFWIVKLTAWGTLEWQKSYGGSGKDVAYSIRQTSDGGYIVAGWTESSDGDVAGQHGMSDVWVIKLDAAGSLQWQQCLGGSGADRAFEIELASDGGYVLAGLSTSSDGDVPGNQGGGGDFLVIKLDETGQAQWVRTLGGPSPQAAFTVKPTQDGGYLVAGYTGYDGGDVSGGNGLNDGWLIKLDGAGNLLWQQCLGGPGGDLIKDLQLTQDGGYVIAGYYWAGNLGEPSSNFDAWIIKFDQDGTMEWQVWYGGSEVEEAESIQQTSDGGFIVAGFTESNDGDVTGFQGISDYWVFKLNAAGELEWQKSLGGSDWEQAYAALETADGGYLVAGSSLSTDGDVAANLGSTDLWIVKLFFPTSALTGYVRMDLDGDCLANTDETPLAGWLVQARRPSESLPSYYALTDAEGHYFMPIDTGAFALSAAMPNPYLEICDDFAIQIAPDDTLAIDFSAQPVVECPYLSVDISAPFLRRCFDNTYTVQYCNLGTAAAAGAYVEVALDPYFTYVSSTIPFATQDGNVYVFELGELEVNSCGVFQIVAYLDCDSTELGQTHCTEAHIFPDSLCISPSAQWDGASIEVAVECEGYSAQFILHNLGIGDMAQPLEFIIIEDQIVLMQGSFQLEALESMHIPVEAVGAAGLRLEAQQSPGHPSGRASTGAGIEGCGGWLSFGFLTQWPTEGANLFVDTDCQQNIGSYDPNDKTGFPLGFTEERLIERGQDIEYLIRFQNTGTDTAFSVVIIDELPAELDLATLRPGASSHAYTYSVTPDGRPAFTFDNILLPDSTTNEPASIGFVRFRISQRSSLPLGTIINNTALIYFDFNEPIQTNVTTHRLGTIFAWSTSTTQPKHPRTAQVRIVPNPFTDSALLQVEDIEPGHLRLVLVNATGQVVREEKAVGTSFEFQRGSLPSGMYFFRIESEGRSISSGKLIVQ